MKPSEIKNADPSAQVAALPEQLAASGSQPATRYCCLAASGFSFQVSSFFFRPTLHVTRNDCKAASAAFATDLLAISGLEKKPKTISAMIDEMLLTIARDLTPILPGRTEPRVKKRRPKNHRLMTKPRKEIGPLPHRKVGVEHHPKSPLT
jgi:hypothetical protein